ncbi:MAG: radical SAM protein [Oligoflexia bacterium]|nr:radical SAM protein [Oligoflexia bacterium]
MFSLLKLGFNIILKRPYPFSVVLRLNDSCNLHCSYCSSPEKDREFEYQNLINYLEEVYQNGCRYVVLTGGEPSMYHRINDLVSWLKERGFYICMNTNGFSINNQDYKDLIQKLDEVAISLDGPKFYHDQLRGKGSHFKALKAIAFAKRLKLRISISPVLHKFNLKSELIDYFVKLRNNHGLHIDYGIVDHRGDVTSEKSSKKIAIDNVKRKDFFEYLRKIKKEHNLSEISDYLIDYMESPKAVNCMSSNYIRFVDITGDIYPCMHVAGESWAKVGELNSFSREYDMNCVQCDYCSCNPILLVNNFLKNKYSVIPVFQMVYARILGVMS